MGTIYVVGTCDTKEAELLYLKSVIAAEGAAVRLVDVGTSGKASDADISAETVASHHPQGREAVLASADRGKAVTAMSAALVQFVLARSDIAGIVGLGGSGGTALISPAMRALPIGAPKLLVSTVASGNTAPYVGPSDITMMYSVVDVAGLNSVLMRVLDNAAGAIVGMARAAQKERKPASKRAIGLTMFGVTTGCVTAVTDELKADFDCLVFHATGTGGQSMEKLAESRDIDAALDLTTTEVCDLLMGGVFPCLPTRFDVFAETRIPYVGSVGALDMVNFGAKDTVPEQYKNRNLYVHNAQVTLMRTTAEENARIGVWIAEKLNQMEGAVRFLLPLGGVSAIDVPGMPFHDPVADRALFDAIENTFIAGPNRKLLRVESAINDPAFVDSTVAAFRQIVR